MNKKRVNNLLLVAKDALRECNIAENGVIDHTFRSQISTFGAAVVMGSLPSAVAFFSEQGGASVKREQLLTALYYCISENHEQKTPREVLEYVCQNNSLTLKEEITDAAIALKLAMNFYDLKKGEKNAKS